MSNDIYRQNGVNLKAGVLRKDCVFVFVDRVSGGAASLLFPDILFQ
jgi:hypothetical protein